MIVCYDAAAARVCVTTQSLKRQLQIVFLQREKFCRNLRVCVSCVSLHQVNFTWAVAMCAIDRTMCPRITALSAWFVYKHQKHVAGCNLHNKLLCMNASPCTENGGMDWACTSNFEAVLSPRLIMPKSLQSHDITYCSMLILTI